MLRKAKPPEVAARSILLLPPAYRQAAIKALHEDTHAGRQQTIKMASNRYIWPGLWGVIKKFVKSCPVCQRVKINKHKQVKPGSFLTEKTPFETVYIDLVRPLPEAEGFKYILMAIDRASQYPIAMPLKSTEATEVWRQFQRQLDCNVWSTYFVALRQRISVRLCLFGRAMPDVWHPQRNYASLPS